MVGYFYDSFADNLILKYYFYVHKNDQLDSIAEILDAAAMEARSIDQISKTRSIDLREAYEIQDRSIQRRVTRNDSIIGYKMGFTSKAKMEQMGVHDIIWGRLTASMQIQANGNLDFSKYIHPRVEPEIAFRINKDINQHIPAENIADYYDAVAPALEIIDSRYQNFSFSLEDVVADNCSSSGFVVGPWHDPSTQLQDMGIELWIDEERVQAGNSNAILGNPIDSLIEASRMMEKYKCTIPAGSIVLAGAATPASYLASGNKVRGVWDSMGEITFSVV